MKKKYWKKKYITFTKLDNSSTVILNMCGSKIGTFFKTKMCNSIIIVYILILIVNCFVGGFMTSLYGRTCGIDLTNPSTWFHTFTMIGSPTCKTLNWICYISNTATENVFTQATTILLTWFTVNIPTITNNIKKNVDRNY